MAKKEKIVCKSCGTEHDEPQKKCFNCGEKVVKPLTDAEKKKIKEDKAKKKTKKEADKKKKAEAKKKKAEDKK